MKRVGYSHYIKTLRLLGYKNKTKNVIILTYLGQTAFH